MASNENTKEKLLDTMRLSKEGATTGAVGSAPTPAAKAPVKKAAPKKAAPKKKTAARAPAKKSAPKVSRSKSVGDTFQSARRVWPD